MKFYIVDEENRLRGNNFPVRRYDEAKQFSFKEARQICDKLNHAILFGRTSIFSAMLPVPKKDEKKVKPTPELKYLIWSFEHNGYWKANQHGYSKLQSEAGLYAKGEAISICKSANIHGLNEAMIPYIEGTIVPKPNVEAKYYLKDEGGYWDDVGMGHVGSNNKDAHHYSYDKACLIVEEYKNFSNKVTMEKIE